MAAKKKKTKPVKPKKAAPKKAAAKARSPAKKKPVKRVAKKPVAVIHPPAAADRSEYERRKERARARMADQSVKGRDIGALPEVVDPERRARAMISLQAYCETYFPEKFFWAWSADHLKAIARLEECVKAGGLFALAMTRGSGKTELCRRAAEWAILSGRRSFVVVLGASDPLAVRNMRDVKASFEVNDLLLEDFPEACFPVRKLGGITNRASGQLMEGERTRIKWTDDEIQMPTIAGSPCAGALLITRGITGAVRGLNVTAADGGSMRPDLVLLDDVQTRESARSPQQTADREATVLGDVLELAGPGTQMAAAMPCTVIYKNDLSERFLDRQKRPEWRGDKFKALYAFPERMDLWRQYAEIRADSFRAGGDGSEATAFYVTSRDEMDRGAVVGWPQRMKPGEVSGLQSCMNVYFDKPGTFAAEWQNEPEAATDLDELRQLAEGDLVKKLNNLARGVVPADCNLLTAFVDVQAEVLMWAVCAWTDRFGGALVDYGSHPRQPGAMFNGSDPDAPLSQLHPTLERGARVYAGLMDLVPKILALRFAQDGAADGVGVSLSLIDARFETKSVHEFIGRSPLRPMLKPSMGRGVAARNKPMNQYRKEPGDVAGDNWRIDAKTSGVGRYVSFNANHWKSFVVEALLAAPGAAGSFYLFGELPPDPDRQAAVLQRTHPLLTVHLLSEYRTPTAGPWGKLEEWQARPETRENHWLDAIVGCAVAASIQGKKRDPGAAAGDPAEPKPKKKRPSYLEAYNKTHGVNG